MPLRRVRVLMLNDSLAIGGAERVAVDLANTLDRDRYEVDFCATRSDGPLSALISPDVDVTVLGRRATWDVPRLLSFCRMVRARRVDLIHSHGRGSMKFVALAKALGGVDARHVFHDHFGWLHVDRRATWGLRRALTGSVDAYLGVEAKLCRWVVDAVGMPPQRVRLARSGVDLSRFEGVERVDVREELGIGPDAVVVAMVASFRPQKDHPTLFRAIAALPPTVRARLALVICGSTTADPQYFAGCSAMIDRLGIGKTVHLLGSRDDVPGVLAAADGAVLSSMNETGPLVVLEYMASGLPFVATDTGEITDSVRSLGVGLVIAPRDPQDLAAALERLVTMGAVERAAMGRRGRAEVVRGFDLRQVVRSVEGVYEEVLGLRSRPVGSSLVEAPSTVVSVTGAARPY